MRTFWKITVHDGYGNHDSREKKELFHISREIKRTDHGSRKYPLPPSQLRACKYRPSENAKFLDGKSVNESIRISRVSD